jgi:hypothetical protein
VLLLQCLSSHVNFNRVIIILGAEETNSINVNLSAILCSNAFKFYL